MTAPTISAANPNTNTMTGTGFVADTVNSNMNHRRLFIGNYDDSISTQDGTPSGSPSAITGGLFGDRGYSLTTSDYIGFGNVNTVLFTSSFTFAAIVKVTTEGIIVSKVNKPAGSPYDGYALYMEGSGNFRFIMGDGVNQSFITSSSGDYRDGTFHSAVASFDSGTGNLELFVDGVSEGTTALSGSVSTIPPNVDYRINGSADGNSRGEFDILEEFFDGTAWNATDAQNWHNQTRHAVNNTVTGITVNSSTEAVSL